MLLFALALPLMTRGQQNNGLGLAASESSASVSYLGDAAGPLLAWQGRTVLRILFAGVSAERLDPLPAQLAQQAGRPLSPEAVHESLRRLYATGLYDALSVEGSLEPSPAGEGVVLTFHGQPRTFIGTVSVVGATGATTNALLTRTSRLMPGTRFTANAMARAEAAMRHALAESGFYEPVFSYVLTPHPEEQLVDIAYKVDSGPQARVGEITIEGDSGLTHDEFQRYAKLRPGQRVNHDTTSRSLNGVENRYRKEQRLEAEVKLHSRDYITARRALDFTFNANRGPLIQVQVEGVTLSEARAKRLIPVYEEGAVDDDLLNEGNLRLQNYYQRLGYFDVKVTHERKTPQAGPDSGVVQIIFHVDLGAKHRVTEVRVVGAKYFDQETLKERLSVHSHDAFDRHGVYNQSLVNADINALQALYQNNGFSSVGVTAEIQDSDGGSGPRSAAGERGKQISLAVTYHVNEGAQRRVHSVEIVGNEKIQTAQLTPMMNTSPGQPLSPETLAGDRDTLTTYYLSRGFDQVQIELSQKPQAGDGSQVNVRFRIIEGEQVFLRRVLITGLHYTRPGTVGRGVTMKAGQPLDQTALLDSQRNLYDLALFNEVNPVIENPTGQEPYKTVLLQTTEARRWDISYGAGFELQTGTVNGGSNTNPNGTVGASPRVLLQVSRINLFGRDQTASLRGNYGLLEQRIDLVYQYPRLFGSRNFSFSFSGGYNNSQDIVTYSASKLEGDLRLTEHFYGEHQPLSKANTFIYQFVYRRVKVNQNSIQVPLDQIPLLSEAVRVGGPSFTWIRDTRDAPLDARQGTYTSFQEFIASGVFGSEANFNQLDVSNSSYYRIDHDRMVVARNTRYGQERAYGNAADELIPLPERLYGGGGNSHRGFGVNTAGPRDPQTGFPIGG
ncbi:MAG TPA: POTRA domain-containing protein, partial [Acidobacteriaceae bacterium]